MTSQLEELGKKMNDIQLIDNWEHEKPILTTITENPVTYREEGLLGGGGHRRGLYFEVGIQLINLHLKELWMGRFGTNKEVS